MAPAAHFHNTGTLVTGNTWSRDVSCSLVVPDKDEKALINHAHGKYFNYARYVFLRSYSNLYPWQKYHNQKRLLP